MNRKDLNIPIDDELKALERALADELRVDTPAGLADRVFDATLAPMRDELAGLQEVEGKLRDELAVPTPRGLAERVYAASVERLPGRAEPEPVIARIGWVHSKAWRVAAAVVLVLVLAAIWLKPNTPAVTDDPAPDTVAVDDSLTEAQIEAQLSAELDEIAMLVSNATYQPLDSYNLDELVELDALLDQMMGETNG